jgi:uncharacterized membrane protein
MPYQWLTDTAGAPERSGAPSPDPAPLARLHLWPFRSLPARGFVWFIGATAVLLAMPLIGLVGSPVLWGLLPFLLAALWAIWAALGRSYRDAEIVEDLAIWPDRVTLTRQGPRGGRKDWQANPHWVEVTLHREGGPVPNYLTLRGAGREVELGAFLSEDERIALHDDLSRRLAALRAGGR